MYQKDGKYFADWRESDGSRRRKSFSDPTKAITYEVSKKAKVLALKKQETLLPPKKPFGRSTKEVVAEMWEFLQNGDKPDLRAIEARLSALERKVDENESRARERHTEVMSAVRDTANYVQVVERLDKLEAMNERKTA